MKLAPLLLIAATSQALLLTAQTPPPAPTAPPDNTLWQPTAQLPERISRWVQFTGTYRVRVEDQSGISFKDLSDFHALGQLQVGVKLRPFSWLSFYGQTQDSRMYLNGAITKAPPYQNTFDIHQVWGEFGSLDRYHFKVRAGRQELGFGEQRLVGNSPWLNAPRVFDAGLVTLGFKGFQVDAFTSSVVNSVDAFLDHHKQGNPFYGIYGSTTKLLPKTTFESYIFWRLAPVGYAATYANGIKGALDEKTFGFRIAGDLPAHFDYTVEMARQSGTLGLASINAWAGHWVVGRTFHYLLKPRLLAEYNYASGTANPNGYKVSTFDQLYPSGHDKFGVVDQVGWRNIRDVRAGLQLKPFAKLNIAGIFHDFWLADARDGLYASNGSVVAKSLTGAGGTHVGQEADIQGFYKLNRAVQFGVGFGHLVPGQFLKVTTPGKNYNYPFAVLTYAF